MKQDSQPNRILRLPETLKRVGLSRSAVYAAIKAKTFVRQVPLGARAVGFLESEVEAWVAARVAARDERVARGSFVEVR